MGKQKKDFSAILDKAKETQVKTPLQKVVPLKPKNEDKDTHKLSLRMYIHEFEDLRRFINYMIIDEKNLNYNMSSAISKGIHILTETKEIERGMPKVKLAVGRKDQTTEAEIKGTSVVIPTADAELLNDFIYYKMMAERNTKYSRVDLMTDLMNAIKEEYPKAF